MKKVVLLFISLTLAGVAILSGCTAAPAGSGDDGGGATVEAEYQWRVSNFLGEAGVGSRSIRHFCDVLYGISDGRVDAKYYGSAALGDSEENFDAVQAGELEIGVISPYSGFHELQNVKGLPFAGSTWEAVDTLFYGDGLIRQIIDHSWDLCGMKCLGYIENSHMVYINKVRPILTPDDFDGLKIRVPPSDVYVKTFERMAPKGIGETIPWTETYTSLERGVVDGTVNYISVYEASKFNEVAKFYTDINQMYNWDNLLINKELYESLPDDVRDMVLEAADVMEADCRFTNRASHLEIMARCEETGTQFTFLTPEQRQVFIDNVNPYQLYEELYKDLLEEYYPGEKMYEQLVNAVKEAEGVA
ncbi:MAG: TRAP transporter substrate-binding protein [Dehalococcoidia bacterium]|nr:TRAP transporter substrate-binding protein [Dehalococcoidia bacterium]